MKSIYYFVIGYILFVATVNGQNYPAFAAMDVFALEWADQPQISPDGLMIVYERWSMDIMEDQRRSTLWLINADGQMHRKLTSREESESGPKWSPSGDRIAFTSSTDEGSELFIYWLESGALARISQLDRSPRGLSWSPDGKYLAFTMKVPTSEPKLVQPRPKPKGARWADHPKVITRLKHEADGSGYIEPGFQHLFVINSDGGTARQLTSGDFNHTGVPQWLHNGKTLVVSGNRDENWEMDFRNTELYAVDVQSREVHPLTDRKGPDRGAIASPDGRFLAYLGFDDRVQTYQISKLYISSADGLDKREVETGLDRNLQDLQWSSDGQSIYFLYDDHGNTKIGNVPVSGGVAKKVADNVGGTEVGRPYGGGSYSISACEQIAFTYTTPYHPAELALIGKDGKMTQISFLSDDVLTFRTLGQVEEVWYKSSVDQLDIQGWVVKPPNFESDQKYPLLVENHGGPVSNYGDRFSPEIQLYASAGFVVFYPNPRGSTSYGEAFGNQLYHNYPGDDYYDVMDGVDFLLERGYLDEDSLFVTGGSAGGIMSTWMIGKNNRFRAAAVIKPVVNWISKTLTADNYYGYAHSRYPGQPWENPDVYMKFSPLSLVGNIETPTLVMVGTADLRTPLSEAKQLYHALKLRGVETALVEVPGAYHFIANRPSQLITKIDHIIAWFAKYR